MPYIYPPPTQGYVPAQAPAPAHAKQGRFAAARYDLQRRPYGHGVSSTRTSLDSRDGTSWDAESEASAPSFDRVKRLSFNGVWDPPLAPDPKTLPPPAPWSDDGCEEIIVHQPMRNAVDIQPAMPATHGVDMYAMAQTYAHPYQVDPYHLPEAYAEHAYAYNPAYWSPSCAAPVLHPMGYGAPLLHPRLVQLPEAPITPHDTYRYPAVHNEHIYVAPTADGPGKDAVNAAFARWYSEQIVSLLVKPGQFRAGVGGSSDEVWGAGGREKDGWIRVGRAPPDYSKASWGRMGMTATPAMPARSIRHRNPACEQRDPFNVIWKHETGVAPALVAFVQDMIQRMTISPSAVLAAVWFMTGLGLHEGDGEKGAEMRKILEEYYWTDVENLAVEKRVAMMGLLLAGKWLDDNSFLTKSWFEVTSIPVVQIDRMERACLRDFHYSLYIPVSSWVDHVNQTWSSLVVKGEQLDDADSIVLAIVDTMVTEAREVEVNDPKSIASTYADPFMGMGYSTPEIQAAADQAISMDWGSFVQSYKTSSKETSPTRRAINAAAYGLESIAALPAPAREVSTVDEAMEEDEEEFLDYDGAKRWLPSVSEMRRSTSQSSAEAIEAWRTTVKPTAERPTPSHHAATPPKPSSHPFAFDSQGYVAAQDSQSSCCPQCRHEHPQAPAKAAPAAAGSKGYGFKETGVFLEPGIAVIRPASSWSTRPSDGGAQADPIDPRAMNANPNSIPHNFVKASSKGSSRGRTYLETYPHMRSEIDHAILRSSARPALASQF